jgi:hypothetical protein
LRDQDKLSSLICAPLKLSVTGNPTVVAWFLISLLTNFNGRSLETSIK